MYSFFLYIYIYIYILNDIIINIIHASLYIREKYSHENIFFNLLFLYLYFSAK